MALAQFLSGSSLPWLQPQEQGPQNLLAGAQIGNSFMENSMRAQQMQQKAELHPLEKQILQDDAELKGLQIAQGKFMQDIAKQKQAGATAAAAIFSTRANIPGGLTDFSGVMDDIGKAVKQFGPSALDNPFAQSLLDEAYKGQQLKDKFDLRTAQTDALNARTTAELVKADADLRIKIAQAEAKGEKLSPGMLAAKEIMDTQAKLASAESSGDTATASTLRQQLELLKDAFPARQNEEISMGMDDQGRPIFKMTKGGKSVGPTVATESKTQQSIIAAQKSHDLLTEVEKQLDPQDLGIRGVVGEAVIDRLAAQFAPDAANLQRADSRTKLKVAIQGMVRQISTDTRFSEADRKRAEEALPSSGALESYPRAIQSIRTLKDILEKRAAVDAQAGGLPRPDWSLSADEIKALYKAGKLTEDKATQLLQQNHPTIRPRGQ